MDAAIVLLVHRLESLDVYLFEDLDVRDLPFDMYKCHNHFLGDNTILDSERDNLQLLFDWLIYQKDKCIFSHLSGIDKLLDYFLDKEFIPGPLQILVTGQI